MPINNTRGRYAYVEERGGVFIWHKSPTEASPIDKMDEDYIANCLRLVHRRCVELEEATSHLDSRGEVINLLIAEDHEMIRILAAALNAREIGDHEDE